MRLLLPFVILPILEIALFIQVGGWIGVLPTLALVILSAVAGVAVMRRQGMVAALDIQRAMQEFRDPTAPMAHGALIMIAGTLMVIPGLFTSAIGVLLLIPGLRSTLLRWMGRRVKVSGGGGMSYRRADTDPDIMSDVPPGFRPGFRPGQSWREDGVIDGEYSVQDDPPQPVRQGLTESRDEGGPRPGNSGWTRH